VSVSEGVSVCVSELLCSSLMTVFTNYCLSHIIGFPIRDERDSLTVAVLVSVLLRNSGCREANRHFLWSPRHSHSEAQ
jgi:hypothetical protein